MADRQMLVASAFVRDGRLYVAKRQAFDAAVSAWPNCHAVLRLEQVLDARSVALNAFYWGVPIDIVSEETGMTPAEAHDEMKSLFLPHRVHAMRGGAICWRCARIIDGTTTRLSNQEEWRYIENIQHFGATVLGAFIPDPELV
jgi:hypothetical protein